MKKNQLEDMFIIFVVLGIIYGIYNFFALDDEVKIEPQRIIEKPINDSEKNSSNTKDINITSISPIKKEIKKENIIQKVEVKKEKKELKKQEPKKEIVIEKTITQPSTLSAFNNNLKKKINTIVAKKIKNDTYFANKHGSLNIRLTILVDGTYERLRYVDGDMALYDFVKKDIISVFPVVLHKNIQEKFPRYFRMKIEY